VDAGRAPWGQLSDRIGRKRVLMLAMSAYTVVYIALAVFIDVALQAVPPVLVSVLVLVGARGLIGLFYAAVPPTAAALIADKAPTGQRAKFLARLGSANALGMVLGRPLPAGWPIPTFRWRCTWPRCCRCWHWHCWPGGCRLHRRWLARPRSAARR
jgi:MFS family permease